MQDLTLEKKKELHVRINQHKMTMLMARIARQYIDEQNAGELKFPELVLERAKQYKLHRLKQAE